MKPISLMTLILSVIAILSIGAASVAAPKAQPKKQPSAHKNIPAKSSKKPTKSSSVKTTASKATKPGAKSLLGASSDQPIDQQIIDLDITPPDLSITSRSELTIENFADPSISLSGQASDDLRIANVKWYTNRDVGGNCTGLEQWASGDIPLFTGENLITVAATDLAGNIGADCITVVCSAKDNLSTWLVLPSTHVVRTKIVVISVHYMNSGVADTTNAVPGITVPTELEYIEGSAEASGGTWNPTTRYVSWAVGLLKAHEGGVKTFSARAK